MNHMLKLVVLHRARSKKAHYLEAEILFSSLTIRGPQSIVVCCPGDSKDCWSSQFISLVLKCPTNIASSVSYMKPQTILAKNLYGVHRPLEHDLGAPYAPTQVKDNYIAFAH